MKKSILIAAIAVLSISSFAQKSSDINLQQVKSLINRTMAINSASAVYSPSSIDYYYVYNNETIYTQETFQYNVATKGITGPVSNHTTKQGTSPDDLPIVESSDYYYIEGDKIDYIESQVLMDEDEWTTIKTTYSYNNQGYIDVITMSSQMFGPWMDLIKLFYSYDDDMNVSSIVTQEYDFSSWSITDKTEFTYNNGLIETETNFTMEDESWIYDTRLVYSYDIFDKIATIVDQYWNNNWQNNEQMVYNYSNGLLETIIVQNWSNSSNSWGNEAKIEYGYDNDKNCNHALCYSWKNNNWVNDTDESLDFTIYYNNMTSNYVLVDEAHETTNITYIINNDGINESEELSFNIYPNPANDHFNISNCDVKHIDIYNLAGQRIAFYGEGTSTISTSTWLPGMYIVIITDTEGASAQRIVSIVK